MSFNSTVALKNETGKNFIDESFDFENNPGLVFVTVACGCASLWFIFLTFYNSRLLGFIFAKLINNFFLKDGSIYIGSWSFSLLSGKMMFRDVRYITKDYSIQIVDGLAIFKWWFKYDPTDKVDYRKLSKDQDIVNLSKYRLTLHLNGLELHVYNRTDLYNNIRDILKCERYGDARKSIPSLDVLSDRNEIDPKDQNNSTFQIWRELFPVIKFKIRSGKIAIGNRLLETTLWIHFNSGNVAYSMPDAVSVLDYFTHLIQCQCDDVRILLSRSPGYKGATTDPPRFMGQGFVVLQCGQAKVCYYQDEPGLVPVAGEDDVTTSPEPDPEWAINVVFTKSATITYGPWVDKQRDLIQKYFHPHDYQEMSVTKPLEPKQKRYHTGIDVNVEFAQDTTLDILFSKSEETSAIHLCFGETSSVHFYQPWTVNDYGYTSNIVANLRQLDISTSMQFRKLLHCDIIEIAVNMSIPRMWNHFQHWTCELWLAKTTLYFIYDHQVFLNDLINDWSVIEIADIAKFVPYEWEFNFHLRDFELILLVNEFNWIDCTNDNENGEFGLCGESMDISFILPFTSFLPEVVETKFFFRGETVMLRNFIPESNTLRRSVIALARSSDNAMYPKMERRMPSVVSDQDMVDGAEYDEVDSGVNPEDRLSKGWRRRTKNSEWIDVWSVPVIILQFTYKYHPIPIESERVKTINEKCGIDFKNIERSKLPPDILTIELEAGPSAVRVFGTFWRQFFEGLKDNYFGVYQSMSEFNAPETDVQITNKKTQVDDIRKYRPFEANVTVVLLDIQAELTMHAPSSATSPQAYADRITFEMHKTFQETRLQLIVSPISLVLSDTLNRFSDHSHLTKGFLTLSGLQFRGHAMFSDKGIPLSSDTVEYAWLMEVQCGILKGKVTPLQLHSLLLWLKTFILHGMDEENKLRKPTVEPQCQHHVLQRSCQHGTGNQMCPTEDEIKYKMNRFSFESVTLFLVEVECACQFQLSPLRFATCNSRGDNTMEGGSFFINEISLRQYVQQVNLTRNDETNHYVPSHSNSWVEVGIVSLGPVTGDVNDTLSNASGMTEQLQFLKLHDRPTKRLWFLWGEDELKGKLAIDRKKSRICGCVGGCNFFGSNINGVRFFTNQLLDAADEKANHYGSLTLWGGRSSSLGSNIKEHLLHRNRSLSTNITSPKTNSFGEKFSPDSTDHARRSMSMLGRMKSSSIAKDTESKFAFGRSTSIMNGGLSRQSLCRQDSDEGTFYSCNSVADISVKTSRSFKGKQTSTTAQLSGRSGASSESYCSAVSSTDDLLTFDETDLNSPSLKPLVVPGLLTAYSNHMQLVTCMNWRQNIPSGLRKKFSLLKNLKVICPPGHRSPLPTIPTFNPNLHGKLPFVLLDKENKQNQNMHKDFKSDKKSTRNSEETFFVSIKIHHKISMMLTPLTVQAIDRYASSFKILCKMYEPCHVLDSLNLGMISVSKEKYDGKKLTSVMTQNLELSAGHEKYQPLSTSTITIKLPEVNVCFLQIASENYSTAGRSSVSGQCGSEYSVDFDIRNTDSVLLAAKLSNIDFNFHQKRQNSLLFHITADILNKSLNNDIPKATLNNFLKNCEPLVSTGQGIISSFQLQVLHIGGCTGKQMHITDIPKQKSAVDFFVKQNGSFHEDNISNTDTVAGEADENDDDENEEEENQTQFGSIMFEAGIDNISVKFFQEVSLCLQESSKAENLAKSPSLVQARKPLVGHHEKVATNAGFLHKKSSSKYTQLRKTSSSSFSDFSLSYGGNSSLKDDYVTVDIDSGDNADTEDDGEQDHPSIQIKQASSFAESSVHYKRDSTRKTVRIEQKDRVKITDKLVGNLLLKKIWVNLPAPTHLKCLNSDNDQDVNLVTVLVPAVSCWITPIVHLKGNVDLILEIYHKWIYSVFACLMGQGLPEHGRLLKKHTTSNHVTDLCQFLQEEYSSQLVSVLRRQTHGHRLINLKHALSKYKLLPSLEELEKGIQALARQWKCILIGAEGTDSIFSTVLQEKKKRPVVGRGVLTQKDLEFLKRDSEFKDCTAVSQRLTSPVANLSKSQIVSPHRVEYKADDQARLFASSSSEDEEDVGKQVKLRMTKTHKEQSLYEWMSKSPSSSAAQSPIKGPEKLFPDGSADVIFHGDGELSEFDVLRSVSPMVSVPTSGMQLAEAVEVFYSVLTAIGIKKETSTIYTEVVKSGTVSVDSLLVDLFTPDENKHDVKEHKSTFELRKFQLLSQAIQEKNVSTEAVVPTDIQFFLVANEIHQHINFALVRLILQVSETWNVAREEKQYAQKTIDANKDIAVDWTDVEEETAVDEIDERILPKGWRNMFNVMNLYAEQLDTQPASPAVVSSAMLRGTADAPKVDIIKAGSTYLSLREGFLPVLKKTFNERPGSARSSSKKDHPLNFATMTAILSITGTALLKKSKFTASISGIELDCEMRHLNATYLKEKKKKSMGIDESDASSSSIHLERLKICLVESVRPYRNHSADLTSFRDASQPELRVSRTLLTSKVYRSHALHSTQKQPLMKDVQRSLLALGPIAVDIPQHPGVLRVITTRFTKSIQKHLSEFHEYRVAQRDLSGSVPDNVNTNLGSVRESVTSVSVSATFRIASSSILVGAALLPSLRAEYKIDKVSGHGSLIGKAKFSFSLPVHKLSFTTKLQIAPLPAASHIDLPPIKVDGHYIEIRHNVDGARLANSDGTSHGFFRVLTNIGTLEQNLTTDLLNHLVFLQQGFDKEVHEVIKDVEDNEPIPLWESNSTVDLQASLPTIYSFEIKVECVQVTATTPSGIGVHFKTGEISFEISNQSPATSVLTSPKYKHLQMFGKARVDLNVSLGQFTKSTYSLNEQDFTVLANFATSLCVSNTSQDGSKHDSDKETILVTLDKPQCFIIPAAVDKGVLVYLYYKNAYDYWVEQRAMLTSEFPVVAEQILNRLPEQTKAGLSSYLFLQFTINDLGVCLPFKEKMNGAIPSVVTTPTIQDNDCGTSLLVTVAETTITCCSSGSFVSIGHFEKFCLRFIDNFDYLSRPWSITDNDGMNTCSIPEGTYKLCSKTVVSQPSTVDMQSGKWLVTLFWGMRGVDFHFDSTIGKSLNLLTRTLTAIAGDADVADVTSLTDANDVDNYEMETYQEPSQNETFAEDVCGLDTVDGGNCDYLDESEPLEKQLWLQTRRVNEFRRNSAHPEVIQREVKHLQDIETALSNEFFNDVKNRFRRKSRRSTINSKKFLADAQRTKPYLELEMKKERTKSLFTKIARASILETDRDDVDFASVRVRENPTIIDQKNFPSKEKQEAINDDLANARTADDEFDTSYTVRRKSPDSIRAKFSKSKNDVHSDVSETTTKTLTPTIALDFDLNVVVDIDSGKCTFHTDGNKENQSNVDGDEFGRDENLKPSERKFAGFHRQLRAVRSTGNSLNQSLLEDPVLLIPGVNVRVHYTSVNAFEKSRNSSIDTDLGDSLSHYSSGKPIVHKTGSLNALVSIQSLPKEMIVRPSLLDFLDKALQPIIDAEDLDNVNETESLNGTESMLSTEVVDLYSFPVHTVVLIRVEPSDVRFSCLPISKVEFLFRVPSLDFAITSTPPPPQVIIASQKHKTSSAKVASSTSSNMESECSEGFSFTLCLSRFSFCIFHPYGKQYDSASDFRMAGGMQSKRREFKPLNQPISGRKDSLSLNVEYIKFNLFRETVRNLKAGENRETTVKISGIFDIGATAINYDMRRLTEILDVPKAWYKRHLFQRIFLGREATYAAKHAQTVPQAANRPKPPSRAHTPLKTRPSPLIIASEASDDDRCYHNTALLSKKPPALSHRRALSTGATFFGNLIGTPFATPKSAGGGHLVHDRTKSDIQFKFDSIRKLDSLVENFAKEKNNENLRTSADPTQNMDEWETRIVMAVNVTRVDISTNMGNVMGQVIWSTNNVQANSSVLLSNTGVKTGNVDVSVRLGSLDAHGGVIGGYLEFQRIRAEGDFVENVGDVPKHHGELSLQSGEVRLDYMGSSVVMASLTSCRSVLEDKWKIPEDTFFDSPRSVTEHKAEIHIMCDTTWGDFQMIISRATAPDLLKIVTKLEEFYAQQKRSGVRALSTLRDSFPRTRLHQSESEESDSEKKDEKDNGGLKYQHWIELLNGLRGMNLNNMLTRLPDKYSLLTGKLSLKGNHLSLACFNGSNFRSQNWCLFIVHEPNMTFTCVNDVMEKSCNVMRAFCTHELSVCLGRSKGVRVERRRSVTNTSQDFMATVHRVSRGRRNPPSLGAPVEEWLMFVNTINASDISGGKSANKQSEVGEVFSHNKSTNGVRKVSFAPKYRYENESEIIFALPEFTMQLKTEHDQPMTLLVAKCISNYQSHLDKSLFPTVATPHLVDASFLSHFEDSIHVTMDVTLLFYLHNLILSYMKEKETSMSATVLRASRRSLGDRDEPADSVKSQTETAIKRDEKFREFRSKEWKLEPRISLLSWAGKRMDPVSIDWVLEKLGFVHAALTIPKWIQRGAMDPIDVALAQLMAQLLVRMKEKNKDSE